MALVASDILLGKDRRSSNVFRPAQYIDEDRSPTIFRYLQGEASLRLYIAHRRAFGDLAPLLIGIGLRKALLPR